MADGVVVCTSSLRGPWLEPPSCLAGRACVDARGSQGQTFEPRGGQTATTSSYHHHHTAPIKQHSSVLPPPRCSSSRVTGQADGKALRPHIP